MPDFAVARCYGSVALFLESHAVPYDRGILGLNETEIETLIDDATRWSGVAPSNPESLDQSGSIVEEITAITDKLGFFLSDGPAIQWREEGKAETAKDLLDIAAQYSRKSEAVVLQKDQVGLGCAFLSLYTRYYTIIVH